MLQSEKLCFDRHTRGIACSREDHSFSLHLQAQPVIGLLHQGSQWDKDNRWWWTKSPRGNDTGQRYVDISELIRYTCTRCTEEGLEGLEILGEVADSSPANEINYLAFEEFAWHPQTSMDDFIGRRLAPIYGGAENAQRFVQLVRSTASSFEEIERDMHFASEVSRGTQLNVRQRQRWLNLRAELARRLSLIPYRSGHVLW